MINPDDSTLNKELRRDEGVERMPYIDTVGVKTVGVGHNMKAKPLPTDWKFPLTDAQVDLLLSQDLADVFASLNKRLPWWATLTPGRQRCLANMAFNLGIDGLMTFTNTLRAIKEGRYSDAVAGMRASKWAKQVGKRSERMCDLMLGEVL